MPKRKMMSDNDSTQLSTPLNATSGAAHAAAAPASPSAPSVAAAALERVGAAADEVHLAKLCAMHSLGLARLLGEGSLDVDAKVYLATSAMEKDATRPQPLIDLAFTPPGKSSCLLFVLLTTMANAASSRVASHDAVDAMRDQLVPLLQKRLPSFDPATVDSAGNNALHHMCRLFALEPRGNYDYKLAEQLIALGVSVHARNKKHRTPLLELAATSSFRVDSAGFRLLLAYGADLNAQDGEGEGVLHHLVKEGALSMLEDLIDGRVADHFDYFLRTNRGVTAQDTAHSIRPNDGVKHFMARDTAQLLQSQTDVWKQSVRSLLLDAVTTLLIPDMAAAVIGYVDGSGPPLAPAADEADPAAVAAVLAQAVNASARAPADANAAGESVP